MNLSALIIFPDEWLQYAPTIINLYRCLSDDGYDVHIIAADNGYFHNDHLVKHLLKVNTAGTASVIARKTGRFRDYKYRKICATVKKTAHSHPCFHLVVGVDSIGYCAARKYFDKAVYLSLEVCRDKYLQKALQTGIDHLIIQTEERRDYLIGRDSPVPVSYIQNAPILPGKLPVPRSDKAKRLLYLGKADFCYGLENLISSLHHLPLEYTLTLKGFQSKNFSTFLHEKYGQLLSEQRLLMDFDYVDQDEIITSIAGYYIAFTGYDMELARRDFNYFSSPAGKLFNYYAAGLPVIGIDIPGLKSIAEKDAGILLKDTAPEHIANAVRILERNYLHYAGNALKAARAFDFRKAYERFIRDMK